MLASPSRKHPFSYFSILPLSLKVQVQIPPPSTEIRLSLQCTVFNLLPSSIWDSPKLKPSNGVPRASCPEPPQPSNNMSQPWIVPGELRAILQPWGRHEQEAPNLQAVTVRSKHPKWWVPGSATCTQHIQLKCKPPGIHLESGAVSVLRDNLSSGKWPSGIRKKLQDRIPNKHSGFPL